MIEKSRKPAVLARRHTSALPKKQRGVTLLIALVLLLLLTLLGLTSSNVAVMQERMAGNLFQTNEAFQLAESTLKAVESRVFDEICLSGGSGGLGTINRMDDLSLDRNDCTLTGLTAPSSAWPLAPGEVGQPGGSGWARFYIAEVPAQPVCDDLSSAVLGAGISEEVYVVLASGRSASGISEAVVQSIYTCLQ
ncbi:MAG: PilX N-terminal domain-containing pilus assembly protein [Pseudomonadota bacterium]